MFLQARFTEALMKDKAKVDFSADRIFSTAETGQPKSEVLKQLEQKHPNTSYHFVEDKLGTLDKVGTLWYISLFTIYTRAPSKTPQGTHRTSFVQQSLVFCQ